MFKSITILAISHHGDALQNWDYPENHPLGGSETAALNMAAALKRQGFDVTLITNEADLSGHQCDVFISLRVWQVFADGHAPGRLNYLWAQDDVNQPLVNSLEDAALAEQVYHVCDGIMLLSHYQQQRWMNVLHAPMGKIFLTTNGVALPRFSADGAPPANRRPWAYYASTPWRGLEPLLKLWPVIKDAVPDAQLHVYSSMKVYNPATQKDDNRELYHLAQRLPGVHYHGSVGQAELRRTAQQCRALAFPSTFPETSCIAAMEAMAAGAVVVGTALGALPETAWHNPLIPLSKGWAERWAFELIRIFTDDRYYNRLARQNRQTIQYYDWDNVAHRWIEQFRLAHLLKYG